MSFDLSDDRLWRIVGSNFVAGLTEHNNKLTGFAPILRGIFGTRNVYYGSNTSFILKEARRRGYNVEEIKSEQRIPPRR